MLLTEAVEHKESRSHEMIPVKISTEKEHYRVNDGEIHATLQQGIQSVYEKLQGVGFEPCEIEIQVVDDGDGGNSVHVKARSFGVIRETCGTPIGDDVAGAQASGLRAYAEKLAGGGQSPSGEGLNDERGLPGSGGSSQQR